MKLLKELSEASGVSGREERIRDIMTRELSALKLDVSVDAMGNLIAIRKPDVKSKNRKRVMFSAHMDEIGFYVRALDEKTGFAYVGNVGGFDYRNLFSRRVIAYGGKRDLLGVMNPAGKPIHIATEEEKKKIPVVDDLVVDFGLPAKKIEKLIEVGTPISLWQEFTEVGDYVSGKAMDNRVACWAVIRLCQQLKKCPHEVIIVASVQEEVGLRGAIASVHDLKPDVGIAIDTTLACDTPGVAGHQTVSVVGNGVALKVMDGSLIAHRGILESMRAVAKKKKIKYQLELLPRGGTDGGALQRSAGARPATTVSIPTRYIHTTCELISPKDLNAAVSVMHHWLEQTTLY